MDFAIPHEHLELLFRIIVAAVLGAILGLERDMHGRQAGLRTHLLVSAGSALFFILSTHVATFDVVVPDGFSKVTDPGRIAAQVVTGIGFLGAGVILKGGFTVVGLTTAACLWISAAIGMAAGAGMYFVAGCTTALSLFALVSLRRFEVLYRKDIYRDLLITVHNDVDIHQVAEMLKSKQVMVTSIGIDRNYETLTTTARISLRLFCKGNADTLLPGLIHKLEQSQIPLKALKWIRP